VVDSALIEPELLNGEVGMWEKTQRAWGRGHRDKVRGQKTDIREQMAEEKIELLVIS